MGADLNLRSAARGRDRIAHAAHLEAARGRLLRDVDAAIVDHHGAGARRWIRIGIDAECHRAGALSLRG